MLSDSTGSYASPPVASISGDRDLDASMSTACAVGKVVCLPGDGTYEGNPELRRVDEGQVMRVEGVGGWTSASHRVGVGRAPDVQR